MKLSRKLLELILSLAKDSHPYEFLGLLESRQKEVITDLVFLPGIRTGMLLGMLDPTMIPLGAKILGSVHSHPLGDLNPSQQDLKMFSKLAGYHIIVGPPYSWESWRCYDSKGNQLMLELVD